MNSACSPYETTAVTVTQLVARQVGDRKVADSWFDSRSDNASLCPRERHFSLFPIGAKQSIRCGGPA